MNNEQLPAFPTNTGPGFDEGWCAPAEGLSKLEAFTKAAMQGLASNSYFVESIMTCEDVKNGHDTLASTALNIARATLSTLQDEQR